MELKIMNGFFEIMEVKGNDDNICQFKICYISVMNQN